MCKWFGKKNISEEELIIREKWNKVTLAVFQIFWIWAILWNIWRIFLRLFPTSFLKQENQIILEFFTWFIIPIIAWILTVFLSFLGRQLIKLKYLFIVFIFLFIIFDIILSIFVLICFYSQIQLIIHPEYTSPPFMDKFLSLF